MASWAAPARRASSLEGVFGKRPLRQDGASNVLSGTTIVVPTHALLRSLEPVRRAGLLRPRRLRRVGWHVRLPHWLLWRTMRGACAARLHAWRACDPDPQLGLARLPRERGRVAIATRHAWRARPRASAVRLPAAARGSAVSARAHPAAVHARTGGAVRRAAAGRLAGRLRRPARPGRVAPLLLCRGARRAAARRGAFAARRAARRGSALAAGAAACGARPRDAPARAHAASRAGGRGRGRIRLVGQAPGG